MFDLLQPRCRVVGNDATADAVHDARGERVHVAAGHTRAGALFRGGVAAVANSSGALGAGPGAGGAVDEGEREHRASSGGDRGVRVPPGSGGDGTGLRAGQEDGLAQPTIEGVADPSPITLSPTLSCTGGRGARRDTGTRAPQPAAGHRPARGPLPPPRPAPKGGARAATPAPAPDSQRRESVRRETSAASSAGSQRTAQMMLSGCTSPWTSRAACSSDNPARSCSTKARKARPASPPTPGAAATD